MDVEEPPLLVVTTETYQHLIGRAARRLVGLPVCEDSQFPGCLLRTVPKGGEKMVYGVCLSVGIFSQHPRPQFHIVFETITHNWETSKKQKTYVRSLSCAFQMFTVSQTSAVGPVQSNYTRLL